MTENASGSQPSIQQLPEAVLQPRSRISLVWLIPVVAVAIGAWLVYKTYSEQGPTITITFETAEGLEAGKTQIRYKDVEVGKVEEVYLSEDLSRVVVTAQLAKGAEKYLTDKTRFWVVRARVAGGQVTGLGTLFGGAYIGIDPVSEGKRTSEFTGLEIPPVVTMDEPGRHYMLHSNKLGSLQIGSPIFFREIKVGEVVAYELSADAETVDIQVFVRAPHHERVHANTRFWNASGFDISLGASGLEIESESLTSLMFGGLAFEDPPGFEPGPQAGEDTVFELYPNRREALARAPELTSQWLLEFSGSVRGLEVGAPVEFRGIKLGQVVDIKLQIDIDAASTHIPVLIEIAPQRIEWLGDASVLDDEGKFFEEARRIFFDQLVAKGFRAQLKTGSLLTGALFVEFDFYPDTDPQKISWDGKYPKLPSIPTPLERIEGVVAEVTKKIQALPLDKMSEEIQRSLEAFSKTAVQLELLTANLNTKAVPKLDGTLAQAQKTLSTAAKALDSADKTISPNSPLLGEVQALLRELGAAARSIRVMADYLERHPEALVRGKGGSRR